MENYCGEDEVEEDHKDEFGLQLPYLDRTLSLAPGAGSLPDAVLGDGERSRIATASRGPTDVALPRIISTGDIAHDGTQTVDTGYLYKM